MTSHNRTLYRMTLDNNQHVEIEADSASSAVSDAIWKHRGRVVIECHTGLYEHEKEAIMRMDRLAKAMTGWIDHTADIPKHDPIAKDAVRPKVHPRLVDSTTSMFAENEMAGGRLAD